MRVARRHPAPEPPAPDVRLMVRLFLPLALTALVLLIYLNSLRNPFVIDAPAAIVSHPDVIQPEGLFNLWKHDAWANQADVALLYRPLTVLSYHLNARLCGLSPPGFRIVNVLMLAGLGCLVAMWLTRYTRRIVAWLAAGLLVAHPCNAEIINHIVGRADLQSMIGIVGFLYLQRRAQETGRWAWWRVLGGLGFILLAVGSKESGLIVLPAAVAQLWVHRRGEKKPSPAPATRRTAITLTILLALLPVLIVAIARIGVLGWSINTTPSSPDIAANPLLGVPRMQRIPPAISLAWFYARQTFWPDTSFLHVPEPLPSWASGTTLAGVLVLSVGIGALLVALRNRHWLSLPLLLAVGQFVAVCHVILPAGQYAPDRVTLPFILAAVSVIAGWFQHLMGDSTRKRAVAVIPCSAAVLAMALVVISVNRQWRSEVDRFAADLNAHPGNATVMYNLGNALVTANRAGEAIPYLVSALAARPDSAQAHYKLARAFLQNGDLIQSAEQFEKVIDRYPQDSRAHLTLAEVCIKSGDLAAAEQHIRVAEKMVPMEPRVTFLLAQLAAARGDRDGAIRLYESLLMREPNYGAARKNYEDLERLNRQ